MFERFTDRARRTLTLAQEESRQFGHGFIGTEHILIGLVHEGEGIAATVLAELGVSLTRARNEVERILGMPPDNRPSQEPPPFTPRAKKVLELALREALRLGHDYIGTEHLLLGIAREGEGVAAQVLVAIGADPARVRERVLEVVSGTRDPGSRDVPRDPGSRDPGPRARPIPGPFRRFPGQYEPVSLSDVVREPPDACSMCGRDLWEVAHYAEAGGIRVCEHCIRAAAHALDSAGSEQRALYLPPRVFGEAPDAGSVDDVVGAVLAVVGSEEQRARRADVAEDAAAFEPHLRALDAKLAGNARVSRIRFVSQGAALVRLHFEVAVEGELSAECRLHRADGRWVVPRMALVAILATAGVSVPPSGA